MIEPAETDAALARWAAIRNAVDPSEAKSVDELRRTHDARRVLLLAGDEGCAIASPSAFPGLCYVKPYVLEPARRRGLGTALLHACAGHARTVEREALVTHVDAADPAGLAFAGRFGFEEIDRQVELVRDLGVEEPPQPPDGIELVSVAERPELLRAVYFGLACEAYEDMPLPDTVTITLEEWEREEATVPGGSFVALADGEIVGYASLLTRDTEPGVAEHGLTATRRDWRGRGVATALKRAQLQWAAANGLHRLVTWTQKGNERMQTLNERLGYEYGAASLTMVGPLPAP